MKRLILLSGVGGAGTTTLCSATADALADEGLRVAVIDAATAVPALPEAADLLAGTMGRAAAEMGGDPVLPEAWTSLAGMRQLSALMQVVGALQEPDFDAVVVDCGDLRAARELVELPAIAVRLLDAALTPRLAMWRSPDGSGEGTVFEALSRLRSEAVRLQAVLASPSTTMRLVGLPGPDAVDRVLRGLALFAMLGVGVDGVIVNRFPRKAEGWSKSRLAEAGALLDDLTARADGVAVWASTSRLRPVPKGRSAMGPLARVQVLDAAQLTVVAGDEDFVLDLPLVGGARAEARVGTRSDDLVVSFDGAVRWLSLPPVLRRCVATSGVRTATGLRIRFVPDPARWRQPEAAS
jgi:arsenite/tail-anchored protein-transporting ATPase